MSEHVTPPSFGGARVLLLESRLAAETAAMVRRLGGEPVSAPAVVEAPIDADGAVREFIERLANSRATQLVIVPDRRRGRACRSRSPNGSGSRRLLQDGLRRATIVARGPKPAGALARRGLTHAMHRRLAVHDGGRAGDARSHCRSTAATATVVHYGERNEPIVSALGARGAVVRELIVYEWQLPLDVAPLVAAIDAIIAATSPILALTSQIQLRHLLFVAGPLRQALRRRPQHARPRRRRWSDLRRCLPRRRHRRRRRSPATKAGAACSPPSPRPAAGGPRPREPTNHE